MTKLYTTTFLYLLIFFQTFGQKKECFCEKDSLMTESISCDTTYFSNQSKMYWQFNCDNIWLTLENKSGNKFKIDEVPVDLYGYTYRLGYHLIKEYKNNLLFRSGCAATGPCSYILIDKNNGKKTKEFDQLICIDTDVQIENEHQYNFDFVVYLSDESIIVDYLEKNKKVKTKFKEKLTAVIPEQQFDRMILENNILTIFYETDDSKKSLKINLNEKTILPIEIVKKIFSDYVGLSESIDSEKNKELMSEALLSLQKTINKKDIPILIDVWMYYDPTDFRTRDFIEPIFFNNKPDALIAIDKRLKNKRKTENRNSAPYTDLLNLKIKFCNKYYR